MRVAVPVPLGQAFTYAVPSRLADQIQPGARVLVEFGRRKVLAVVLRDDDGSGVPPEKIKPIVAVVDPLPVIPLDLLRFLLELARYYLAPIGEVMRLALPAVERTASARLDEQGLLEGTRMKTVGRLIQVVVSVGEGEIPPKIKGQARGILEQLREQGSRPVAELTQDFGNARNAIKKLADLELVRVDQVEQQRDPFFAEEVAIAVPPEPTEPQRVAISSIVSRLEGGEGGAFLLHGVTGSGKTEVYLQAVKRCLELGRGAIILVPEIALTPQLVHRFRSRVGDSIAVLHSGLSEADRHVMWRKLRSGEVSVAVGARSALFAPIENLGLICVDEEHDGSFKQEEGVRYNARDMALLRAHRSRAVCVLGSATPALSTIALATKGRIERLSLPERAHRAAVLPKVELIDLRRIGPGPSGDKLLSLPLHRALAQALELKEQAILFLNRRGFAPSLVCESCGHLAECPHCSVSLTLHRYRGAQLTCHYCDFTQRRPERCPSCQSEKLSEEGSGTERIEALLAEAFPEARVGRLDRDVGGGLKSEKILAKMRSRELDILVGTQMVTKGHDLPDVTLVGVLNADTALSMPDFRAAERTFQQLVQVAGRAGRGDRPGTVMIQTRQPEHPAVALAARHDVNAFVKQEMLDRDELGYPPFSFMAMIRVDAVEERRAREAAAWHAGLAERAGSEAVTLRGPAPAPLGRLRNRYRFQFTLRADDRAALRAPLLAILRAPLDRKVRVSVDVDPVSML